MAEGATVRPPAHGALATGPDYQPFMPYVVQFGADPIA